MDINAANEVLNQLKNVDQQTLIDAMNYPEEVLVDYIYGHLDTARTIELEEKFSSNFFIKIKVDGIKKHIADFSFDNASDVKKYLKHKNEFTF